jgi:molybdopterin synthase sulfur carrier subunit
MKTIRLMATVRDMAGTKFLDVPFEAGGTVRELIAAIGQVHPAIAALLVDEQGCLSSVVHIYVGGRNVEWLRGLDTVIREADAVLLIPPVAGG